jgi:nitroreductase
LEVALQAPSASNRQAWHWVVIDDESIRRPIGDYYRRAVSSYLNSSASAASLFADDPERSAIQHRVGESVAYLGEHMGEVPVLVIPCISAPSLRAGSQAGLWGSLLPAAWSYMFWRLGPADWVPRGRRCTCDMRRRSQNSSGCRQIFGKAP